MLLPFIILQNWKGKEKLIGIVFLLSSLISPILIYVLPEKISSQLIHIIGMVLFIDMISIWEGINLILMTGSLASLLLSVHKILPKSLLLRGLALHPYLIVCIIYILVVSLGGFFERYALPALVMIVIEIFSKKEEQNAKSILQTILLIVLLSFSLYSNLGFVSSYSQRAYLIEQAESLGGSPLNIDAGLEYGGMHNFKMFNKPEKYIQRWWVIDDLFIISDKKYISGYTVLDSTNLKYPYVEARYYLHKRKN
ncbi:MAG: hypothetical protein Pars93KO_27550 [Parasphingorhabdus sp.]